MSLVQRIRSILKSEQKSNDDSLEKEIKNTVGRLQSEMNAKKAQKERLTRAIFEHKDNIIQYDRYSQKAQEDNDLKLANTHITAKEKAKEDLKKLKDKNVKLAEQLEEMDQTYETLSGRLEDYQIRIKEVDNQKQKLEMDKKLSELEAYEEQLQYEVGEAKALLEITQYSYDFEVEKEVNDMK